METVIAALISGAVTLVVCMVNNQAQSSKTRALLDYRLNALEKKVDKHNQVVERTFRLEGQLRECTHEISDLKKYHQPN